MISVRKKEFDCPKCGQTAEEIYYMEYDKPWISQSPIEGLSVYGPYSADKGTVCEWKEDDLWRIHFMNRIVKQMVLS